MHKVRIIKKYFTDLIITLFKSGLIFLNILSPLQWILSLTEQKNNILI